MMNVRRSATVVIVAGLIAAAGCASRDVEVRTAGPNDGSAEVAPVEKSVAEFFAALDEVAFRGMVLDVSPLDSEMFERNLRFKELSSVFVGRLVQLEDAGVGPYILGPFEPTGKDEQRLRATFATDAGERSVLLPAGTRNSLPGGWPADLSPLVNKAPIGAEMLVVVDRDRGGEEVSAVMVAQDWDGSSVTFGVPLRPGATFRGLLEVLDRANG